VRALVLCATTVLVAACGKSRVMGNGKPEPLPEAPLASGPAKGRGPLATDADAIRAFRAAWREEIAIPSKKYRPRGEGVERVLSGHVTARRVGCRVAQEQAQRAYLPELGDDVLLFDHASALARDGECWEVLCQPTVGSEVVGYMDATTGALVHALIHPEG
jgi:hypothetical protein